MTVSVMIADDHGLLRAGLRSLLSAEPDLQVVGEAADGYATLQLVPQLCPDVLLADISMPGPTGIELAYHLAAAAPQTRVLILTMHEDRGLVQEAMQAGARGYIIKRAVESDLISAIRTVAAGGTYIHHDVRSDAVAAAAEIPAATSEAAQPELTPGEVELLRLLGRGHTTQQIAVKLGIDSASVDRQRGALSERLGLRSRIDVIKYAREHGL